jgi:hypothetical protein
MTIPEALPQLLRNRMMGLITYDYTSGQSRSQGARERSAILFDTSETKQ